MNEKMKMFAKLAREISKEWDEMIEQELPYANELNDDYPFEKSFDEIVLNIEKWVETNTK